MTNTAHWHPETSVLVGGWGGSVKRTVKEGGTGFSLYLEKKGPKIILKLPSSTNRSTNKILIH
jgi:hypothetical protein